MTVANLSPAARAQLLRLAIAQGHWVRLDKRHTAVVDELVAARLAQTIVKGGRRHAGATGRVGDILNAVAKNSHTLPGITPAEERDWQRYRAAARRVGMTL